MNGFLGAAVVWFWPVGVPVASSFVQSRPNDGGNTGAVGFVLFVFGALAIVFAAVGLLSKAG